ncbi:MAG TPA: carboxypeptidase regulatory-like domain-containing protein, partial [Bacteroidetes bacterium]|nr:carboxypeptidase regulatory-like domain-containing protein [Bacteroidota bacterium]
MKKYIIIILTFLALGSCRKDKDITVVVDNEYPTEKYINTSLKGLVVGNRDIPIENATVSTGDYTLKTDFNGYFYFQDIKVNKDGATVKVSKEGYRTVTKTFYPQLNSTTYIQIRMEPGHGSTIINSGDKEKNFGSTNSYASIEGNTFEKDGEKYSGELMVNHFWTIFYKDDFESKYIAHPVGYDKYFNLKGLNSYGIVGLDLQDRNGNEIELGSDNAMELRLIFEEKVQLPENLPQKIPVWFFDDTKDKWIEKAEAVFDEENRYYTVFVKKSGYWNFATPIEIAYSQVAVKSKNDKLLPYIKANLSTKENNYFLSLRSNSDGYVNCFLPKDNNSKIEFLIDNKPIVSNIDPDASEIKLSTIFKVLKTSGDFYNCNDEKIESGYITYFTDTDSMFYRISNGKLEKNIIVSQDMDEVKWFATDLNTRVNTKIHNTHIVDDNLSLENVFLCPEPFAILRYGEERQLLELKGFDYNDPPVLAIVFENDNYYLDLGFFDFKGESDNYNFYNFGYTIIIVNKDDNRLFPVINAEQAINVNEFDNPGMMRGHIEGMAFHKDSGEVIDT